MHIWPLYSSEQVLSRATTFILVRTRTKSDRKKTEGKEREDIDSLKTIQTKSEESMEIVLEPSQPDRTSTTKKYVYYVRGKNGKCVQIGSILKQHFGVHIVNRFCNIVINYFLVF